MSEDKVRENRLRRAAGRQGLLLVKSRRRDPKAIGYGRYILIEDTTGNRLPDAETRQKHEDFVYTLDDVERVLKGE